MDWDRIEQEIYEGADACLAELVGQAAGETIYAFCLYTDSDGGSVVPSANSEEGYAYSLAQAGECTDLDRRYYRWAPEEWKYCASGDHLNAVSRKLFDRMLDSADVDLDHTAKVMVRALDRLRGEEAYMRLAGPPVLFISVSDDDRAEDLEKESVLVLNSPERAGLFLTHGRSAGRPARLCRPGRP